MKERERERGGEIMREGGVKGGTVHTTLYAMNIHQN